MGIRRKLRHYPPPRTKTNNQKPTSLTGCVGGTPLRSVVEGVGGGAAVSGVTAKHYAPSKWELTTTTHVDSACC